MCIYIYMYIYLYLYLYLYLFMFMYLYLYVYLYFYLFIYSRFRHEGNSGFLIPTETLSEIHWIEGCTSGPWVLNLYFPAPSWGLTM